MVPPDPIAAPPGLHVVDPAPAAPPGSISVPLAVPIDAHGERLTVLVLRRLTVPDINEANELPINLDGAIVPRAVSAFIAKLAAIPPTSVNALAPGDWLAAMGAIIRFFGKQVPTS
jgi:hypothetical protein